jgi:hypothetical protein
MVGRKLCFLKMEALKRKFKCWLTDLKCCGEDLVVQEDYYCCLNNLSFTGNYNLCLEIHEVFCWIVHHELFQYIEIIPPAILSEIVALIPWGWGSTFLAIVTSSIPNNINDDNYRQNIQTYTDINNIKATFTHRDPPRTIHPLAGSGVCHMINTRKLAAFVIYELWHQHSF